MSWWTVIAADLARSPMRTFLMVMSLISAFLLFGILQPIRVMFSDGIALEGDQRLIVAPKHSVADMLPVNHGQRISQIDYVNAVAHMTWFGGIYQDKQNFFPQFAVTPETFLSINPEIRLSNEAAQAFIDTRRGAIVGRSTAERFSWRVGETIQLVPSIWHNRDGTSWSFELVGIFDSSNEALLANDGFYFGYPYFDEYRAFGNGSVGSFVVEAADVSRLTQLAALIDAEFNNSTSETRTQSGAEYALSFARQLGDVGLIATIVLVAVLFTLLMLIGHTIARSIQERALEVAVYRVLGFERSSIGVLLVGEFLVLIVLSAALGLGAAYVLASQLEDFIPQISQFGGISVDMVVVLQGLAGALFIGILVATWPVFDCVRRPILSALRQGV